MADLSTAAVAAPDDRDLTRRFLIGTAAFAFLFLVAAIVGHLPGIDVHAGDAAPLVAGWHPRVGIGTPLALAVAWWSVGGRAALLATSLSWARLLLLTWFGSLTWMLALALVDGRAGIARVLGAPTEYLPTASRVHDVAAFLRGFVERIPIDAQGGWPTHVAGHPPGATLVFVALDRVGLGSGLAAGLVVCMVAATTPVAVAIACQAAGAEADVRVALPFLVIGPSAVWQAVSADAIFAAAAAWLVALTVLAASSRREGRGLLAMGAGVLLGGCVLLSYGLPLVGLLVAAGTVAVLGLRTSALRLLGGIGLVAAVVVASLSLSGFDYWAAYPVLRQRYWDGIAALRPTWYWVWADLAVLAVSAGPVLGGGLAAAWPQIRGAVLRPSGRPLLVLSAAAVVAILLADSSLMSKAEVERIWLPFLPWALLLTAFVPARWRPTAFAAQVVVALVAQHLLVTPW